MSGSSLQRMHVRCNVAIFMRCGWSNRRDERRMVKRETEVIYLNFAWKKFAHAL